MNIYANYLKGWGRDLFTAFIFFFFIFCSDLILAQTTWTIGTGTGSNTSTTIPAPFANSTKGTRQQYVYKATELTAAGMTGGVIHKFGFNVLATNNCGVLQSFSIKMKNSSTSNLTAFQGSMTTVVNAVDYTPVTGWNVFTLDNTFTWDGSNNIIIEVCFYSSGTATANASTEWTTGLTTGISRTLTTNSNSGICGLTTSAVTSTSRPNARFVRNPQSYTSSTTAQASTANVSKGSTNAAIINVQVVMNGSDSPLNLTQLNFNTTGSTNPTGDITSAKVYYTGTINSFSTGTLVGSFSSPNGSFNISGTQALANGTNYFWLAYDVPAGATISNILDATCSQITVGGTTYTPSVTNPAGSRPIVAPVSATVAQASTANVTRGSNSSPVIDVQVVMNAANNSLNLTQLNFNTSGSTNPSGDITSAKVYYSGTSSSFSTATLFGSFSSPNGSFNITGTQALASGTNHFWLTYDIPGGAAISNTVDAQCLQITVGGQTYSPSVTDPAGSRTIIELVNPVVIGTGTNSNSSQEYPAPFGNFYTGTRHQFIYLASELSSSGFSAGTIDRLGFNVTAVNGSAELKDMTIKIGNTSTGAFVNAYLTGTNTFYGPTNYQPVDGWNMIELSSPFTWDGVSNIVVEICFNNWTSGQPQNYTANASTEWTDVGFNATRYRTLDNSSTVCSGGSSSGNSTFRPNIKFERNTPQAFNSVTVIQPFTAPASAGGTAAMIAVKIDVTGAINPLTVTQLNFNTTGSTNPAADISNARVYYTGTSSSFSSSNLYGSAALPDGAFNITGSQTLQSGTNYFWLAYEVSSGAGSGDLLDAQCTQITVEGIDRIPTVTNPAGSRTISVPTGPPSVVIGSGTGANGPTEYPAPFGNFFMGARHQFIYRASELTASGFNGTIERFGFNVISVNGSGILNSFSIKMKNSSTDNLSNFESGMTTVVNSVDYQPVQGWNMFSLDTPFEWDGTSNIIVETCFYTPPENAPPQGYTFNASLEWTTGLGAGTAWYLNNDNQSTICSDNSGSNPPQMSENRPNARFARNSNQVFVSGTTTQSNTTAVPRSSTNVSMIAVKVDVTGNLNPLTLTGLNFNTDGSTNPAGDLASARVYYTGSSSSFSAATTFGSTVSSPNGSFNITGSQVLVEGTNYFWLIYNLTAGAGFGDSLDAQCPQFTVNGIDHTPDETNPAGSRAVAAPLNGEYVISAAIFSAETGISLGNTGSVQNEKREIPKKLVENPAGKNNQKAIPESLKNNMLVLNNSDYSNPLYYKLSKNNNFSSPNEVNYVGVYATITAAISDLNTLGVGGPVTFTLADNTYPSETFPLIINPAGSNPTAANTVTIQPAGGKNVLITGNADILKIVDCGYITINGNPAGSESLTLESTGNGTRNIMLSKTNNETEHNITIKNITIINNTSNSGGFGISTDQYLTAGILDNIIIQNNVFKKCSWAMTFYGSGLPAKITNLTISDNDLSSSGADAIGNAGVFLTGVNGGQIARNTFGNFDGTYDENDNAIWLQLGVYNVIVERNKIFNINYTGANGFGAIGIYVTSEVNSNITIKNNVIYNLSGDGSDYFAGSPGQFRNVFGIYLEANQSGINVYNNSINLSGNTLNKTNAISAGIAISGAVGGIDVRNNSIVNNLGRLSGTGFGAMGIFCPTGIPPASTINYNNIYVNPSGSGQKLIGKLNELAGSGNTYTTLAAWRTDSGFDANSASNDPGYTSGNNLLPDATNANSWTLNGKGIQIASVTNDYTGSFRSSTIDGGVPDIGAYEFTPSVLPPNSSQSGTLANNSSMTFSWAGNSLGTLTWGGSGTTPLVIDFQFYSGTNPPGIDSAMGNVYWKITPIGGSGFSYNLTFNYSEAMLGKISSESLIRISKSENNGTDWNTFIIAGTGPGEYQLDSINNIVTIYGLTDFSLFALTDGASPLPVELSTFTASSERLNTILKWETATEINNYGFEVERRRSQESEVRSQHENAGSNTLWEKTGFVKGNGTSNSTKKYEYKDKNLSAGKYLYRLKQIDSDGTYEYSEEIEVEVGSAPLIFNLSQNYPNPFNPETMIEFTVPETGQTTLKVYDILGAEVKTLFDQVAEAGVFHQARFNGSDLATGIYIARLQYGNQQLMKKMLMIK